jgi:CubicO group peptidase (beta-lactamase class C family)
MRGSARRWLAALWAALLMGCAASPWSLLREASGSVSQQLCSKTFVSGLDPDAVYAEYLRPQRGMSLVSWALRYEVDRATREVRTRIGGGVERRAVFREGRGCTLVAAGLPAPEALQPERASEARPELPDVAIPEELVPPPPGLRAALAAAFAEPDARNPRATKAVVIVHRGRLIAERYAEGYGPDTPLLGRSLTKSVINALIGVLVRSGRLSVEQPPPVAVWTDPERQAITIDQLLRMEAGFGFDEGGGPSVATHMWFDEADTAAFAASAERSTPGRWGYSSRSYVLLSRILRDAIGEPQSLRDFAERELFRPLGMRNVTLEFDAAGTPMGDHAMLASARDWARFGLLYLRDGVMGQRRILPEGWVAYSTRPTGSSGYGAGFWLNHTHAQIPEWGVAWGLPGAPPDAFMARGYLGQYVVIVPSAELVVVRFGASHARGAEVESVGRLVRDVIASMSPGLASPATGRGHAARRGDALRSLRKSGA